MPDLAVWAVVLELDASRSDKRDLGWAFLFPGERSEAVRLSC